MVSLITIKLSVYYDVRCKTVVLLSFRCDVVSLSYFCHVISCYIYLSSDFSSFLIMEGTWLSYCWGQEGCQFNDTVLQVQRHNPYLKRQSLYWDDALIRSLLCTIIFHRCSLYPVLLPIVYPIKCAYRSVVIHYLQSYLLSFYYTFCVDSGDSFTHNAQGYFIGNGAIIPTCDFADISAIWFMITSLNENIFHVTGGFPSHKGQWCGVLMFSLFNHNKA